MMQRLTRTLVLFAGAVTLPLAAAAQKLAVTSTDVAATFSFERAQVAQVNGNSFWLKGGSAEAAMTFFGGLGLAANLTGEHAANIQNGVSLGKMAFMAGPAIRSTCRVIRSAC